MGVSKRKGARRRNYGDVPRAVVIEREVKVWELTKKCMTQATIAKELGISQVSVMRIQKRVEARMAAKIEQDFDHVKKTHLAQLNRMAEETMIAWEESKKPRQTIQKTIVGQSDKPEIQAIYDSQAKMVTTQAGSNGDPSYISECRAALADIRKILGTDAPMKLLSANMEMSWMDLLKRATEQANTSDTGSSIPIEAQAVESKT